MVFQWKQGSHIKADAQQAGILCSRLEAEGRLTAKALLDESRDEDSPLHGEFEWNDGIAAEKYRENQARHIINCLVTAHESTAPTRSFFNVEYKTAEYMWTANSPLTTWDLKSNRICSAKIKCFNAETSARSEERSVGKECRSRWSPYH